MTLAAVLSVVHSSHKDTSTALLCDVSYAISYLHIEGSYLGSRAFSPQTLDLAITVDFVILEDS